MHLGLKNDPFVPHNLTPVQGSPVPLLKFQITPKLKLLMSSRSKKRPRYTCLSEAKSSHSQGVWLKFHTLLHTSYLREYWFAPLSEDVFARYDDQ